MLADEHVIDEVLGADWFLLFSEFYDMTKDELGEIYTGRMIPWDVFKRVLNDHWLQYAMRN
uniref:Uncharacterized protein n=1 Tax=viral metagenome TaxID=1070528 RepID=A0A6M3Y0W4_9ZZZZ